MVYILKVKNKFTELFKKATRDRPMVNKALYSLKIRWNIAFILIF